MKSALLDTNVLLALAWPNHQHHAAAHDWFRAQSRHGWATCAFTQLAFIRLSSNPAYTADAATPQEAAALLHTLIAHKTHRFWPSPPADNATLFTQTLGHQQVNDAWLVEAARRQRGRIVTLDTRLPVHARGEDAVFVIPSRWTMPVHETN